MVSVSSVLTRIETLCSGLVTSVHRHSKQDTELWEDIYSVILAGTSGRGGVGGWLDRLGTGLGCLARLACTVGGEVRILYFYHPLHPYILHFNVFIPLHLHI